MKFKYGALAIGANLCLFSLFCRDLPPEPRFDGPVVECKVTLSQSGLWTCKYEYFITNPSQNEADCGGLEVVVAGVENEIELSGTNPDRDKGRIAYRNPSYPKNIAYTPNETFVSWIFTTGEGKPGVKEGPLAFVTYYPPQIREAWTDYNFFPYVDSLLHQGIHLNEEELDALQLHGIRKIKTLGPLKYPSGAFQYWNQFLADVDEAKNLMWIKDATFYSSVKSKLVSAHDAVLNDDLVSLNARLQEVVALVDSVGTDVLTQEGRDLLWINAKWLQDSIPWPCEPKLTLNPLTGQHIVGETHTVSATLINAANLQALANEPITFNVTEGPNYGEAATKTTDLQGVASFTYLGRGVGRDIILAQAGEGGTFQKGIKSKVSGKKEQTVECHPWGIKSADVSVDWTGGVDLSIISFSPSVLISKPGNQFYVYETTKNQGNITSPPTITKYYLSLSETLESGILVGQREVKSLEQDEMNRSGKLTFVIPAGLAEGKYYLWACADADFGVIETNEDNNCSYMNPFIAAGTLMIEKENNNPPDCSGAVASVTKLWPPNHKLAGISIQGVTDPDGDAVTLTVTSITQDEPVNGLGDGDTSPDGFGVGTANPQVRAERSGTGNGRVYRINFKGTDAKGAECTGAVAVGVPHDKKDTPVDDGQNYDSTLQ